MAWDMTSNNLLKDHERQFKVEQQWILTVKYFLGSGIYHMQIRDTWSSNNRSLHWKVKFWSMTSGQGHDLTQTGHATCRSVCLDARNTVNLFWSLYHAPIKSYCSNTVFDLWWRHVTSGVQKRAICSNGVKIHFSRQHSLLLSVFWGYWWEFTIIGGLRIFPIDL